MSGYSFNKTDLTKKGTGLKYADHFVCFSDDVLGLSLNSLTSEEFNSFVCLCSFFNNDTCSGDENDTFSAAVCFKSFYNRLFKNSVGKSLRSKEYAFNILQSLLCKLVKHSFFKRGELICLNKPSVVSKNDFYNYSIYCNFGSESTIRYCNAKPLHGVSFIQKICVEDILRLKYVHSKILYLYFIKFLNVKNKRTGKSSFFLSHNAFCYALGVTERCSKYKSLFDKRVIDKATEDLFRLFDVELVEEFKDRYTFIYTKRDSVLEVVT